jgi:hypothetical protein
MEALNVLLFGSIAFYNNCMLTITFPCELPETREVCPDNLYRLLRRDAREWPQAQEAVSQRSASHHGEQFHQGLQNLCNIPVESQIKDVDMWGICTLCTVSKGGPLKERCHLEGLSVDEKIILNRIVQKSFCFVGDSVRCQLRRIIP